MKIGSKGKTASLDLSKVKTYLLIPLSPVGDKATISSSIIPYPWQNVWPHPQLSSSWLPCQYLFCARSFWSSRFYFAWRSPSQHSLWDEIWVQPKYIAQPSVDSALLQWWRSCFWFFCVTPGLWSCLARRCRMAFSDNPFHIALVSRQHSEPNDRMDLFFYIDGLLV